MKWILLLLLPAGIQAQSLKPGIYHQLKPTQPLVLDTGSFTLINLQMKNLGKGIWLDGRKASRLTIMNSTFEGNGSGIGLAVCKRVSIHGSHFRNLNKGVLIKHNKKDHGTAKGQWHLNTEEAVAISGNSFEKLNTGIDLEAIENNALTVRGNAFTDVGIGVWLHSGDENVTPAVNLNFTCNQFRLSCMDEYPSNGPAITNSSHPCFDEFTNGPNRVGLFVGENVAIDGNIGGPGGTASTIVPAGNVWPVGNKSQAEIELSSYELTGWVHPPNFTAVVNESEEGWTYYHFTNEFFNLLDNSFTGNALEPSKQRIAKTPDQEIPVGIDPNLVDEVCPNFGSSIVFPLLPRPSGNLNALTAIKNELKEEQVVLGQNIPNPGQNTTTIPFYLPSNVKRARLEVFELGTGRVLKGFDLLHMGHGAIEFETRSLSAGMFGYRLLTNGQPAAHMKMVITH